MDHTIKTLQPYYDDVVNGKKNFEIRRNDRHYQVGDKLILMEYDARGITGRSITKTISYILKDCPQYGLYDGYCILGIS